jgi:hypothetical protein
MLTSTLSLLGSVILVLATLLHPTDVDRPVPRPSDDSVAHVTGVLAFSAGGTGGVGTLGEYALQWRDVTVDARLTTNDPRLSGELTLTWNCDVFRPDWVHEGSGAVATGAVVLHGERGSWEGVWHGLMYPEHGGDNHHILLSGVGRHQGRSALLYLTHADDAGHLLVEGVVFPGEPPPCPVLRSADAPATQDARSGCSARLVSPS